MEKVLKKMVENGYNGLFTVEVFGFERQLQKVLEIAQAVSGKDYGVKRIDWRGAYAIYSRRYLEEVLK